MHKGTIGYAVFLRYLHQFEEMIQARVYATIGTQAHEMQFLTACLSCFIGRFNLRILHNRVVANRAIDLHQILIHYAAGTDIEVAHLGVTHLTVRQTYILSARL